MRYSLSMAFHPILLLVICCVFSATSSKAEEIKRYWTIHPYHYWFGKIDPRDGKVSYTLNNSDTLPGDFKENIYKDVVHAKIPLRYKVNTLSIKQGGMNLFKAEIFYAPSYENLLVEKEDEIFDLYLFHTAENEQSCAECHRMSTTEKDLEPEQPKDSMCFPCHSIEFSNKKILHKPSGITWKCLACHRETENETDFSIGTPSKYTLENWSAVGNICYKCHEKEKKQYQEYKFLHVPVGSNSCNMCHNPHGSDQKHLLHKEPSQLCIECHALGKIFDNPVIHGIIQKKGCMACHNPHGSDYCLQLFNEINESCCECHEIHCTKIGRHPVAGHPVTGPVNPRNKDKKFSCVSCHNPHSAEHEGLLLEADRMMMCVHCHTY